MFTCNPCECGGHPECDNCGAKLDFLLEIEPDRWFIHKHEIRLNYGGPEEGGWNYKSGIPVVGWDARNYAFESEDEAIAECYHLNMEEHDRQKREETYEFTSVVAYLSTHYEYDVSTSYGSYSFPEGRPHYE